MDVTVQKERRLFQLLPTFYLAQTYGLYTGEFCGQFLGSHADVAIRKASWSSIIAAGGFSHLEMLTDYYWKKKIFIDRYDDKIFKMYCFGDETILGIEFGFEGTHYIYFSPFDLFKTGYFGPPNDLILHMTTEDNKSGRAHADCDDSSNDRAIC